MKSIVMAIMAVVVAATFSTPAFAGEEKKDKKDEIWGHILTDNLLPPADEEKKKEEK